MTQAHSYGSETMTTVSHLTELLHVYNGGQKMGGEVTAESSRVFLPGAQFGSDA